MSNRLASAISPYLRSHAGNPVDWYPWGEEAFAEATRRDVPVLVSIGYSTCHWCHVMARESFSDPAVAADLNARFVAIKVDREEHPDVDATYLAAAGAFTQNLGWPLNVFLTPAGRAFFAGTYFPPRPAAGQASFTQVLDAVSDAWSERRAHVERSAARVAEALAAASVTERPSALPDADALDRVVEDLAGFEDAQFGGFGTAPKFPMAPVLGFLLEQGARSGPADDGRAAELAVRTLRAMASSPVRDPVEGGFFRYSMQRDWSQPHYERMLYDNAQLLDAYTRGWQLAVYAPGDMHGTGDRESGTGTDADTAAETAAGIAGFLIDVMQRESGGFASAQDSESIIDGERVEGAYYALDAGERAAQHPPALDEKVLTGWNGLAIAALAHAGFVFARPEWVHASRRSADYLLDRHLRADGTLLRASIDGRLSDAAATLEDYGMFAGGLLELALATGEARYAVAARALVDRTLAAAAGTFARADGEANTATGTAPEDGAMPFAVPGGADPVLAARGLAMESDPSEGAYPSGVSAIAGAARALWLLTADSRYADAARTTLAHVAAPALKRPVAFGAALALASAFDGGVTQLVIVMPDVPESAALTQGHIATGSGGADDDGLVAAARRRTGALTVVVTEGQARAFADAGFELFADRRTQSRLTTAYLCHDFVCRLPVTDAAELG